MNTNEAQGICTNRANRAKKKQQLVVTACSS